jgi:protein-tyrosine phosphatase
MVIKVRLPSVKTILIVCTANICRSPMAAALLRKRIAERGLADQVTVQSAGVFARSGQAASDYAVTVLGDRSVPLADHHSQPVTVPLLKEASIILVMEESHRRSLFYMAPECLSKVFLLTEMAGRHEDVADPYGGELEDYIETANTLDTLINGGLPNILRRIGVTETSPD